MARRWWSVCCGLALALAIAGTAPARAATLASPGGFRLQGSNGYSIRALAGDGDPRGRSDVLILFLSHGDEDVTYAVQQGVEVTEETIVASLGRLGSIDLHFVPTGTPRTEEVGCFSKPIEFHSGFYEGRFDFE